MPIGLATRRTFLKLAVAAATAATGTTEAVADEALWQEISANADRFRQTAQRLKLIRNWSNQEAPVISVAAPASEAELAGTEATLGKPLPQSLRRLFGACSADINVEWWLPSEPVKDKLGGQTLIYSLLPPPLFVDAGNRPTPANGAFRLSLDRLPYFHAQALGWQESIGGQVAASGAEIRPVLERHLEFWRRGFPIAQTMGGDLLAIDTTDVDENLIVLYANADDLRGCLLGMDINEFVHQQSRLGFVGFERHSLEPFVDHDRSGALRAKYGERPDEKGQMEIPALTASVIDTEGAGGRAWRGWLAME
ncbi:hypothetical protein MAUB1S_10297 [Mycolicibacterium aubagnense]